MKAALPNGVKMSLGTKASMRRALRECVAVLSSVALASTGAGPAFAAGRTDSKAVVLERVGPEKPSGPLGGQLAEEVARLKQEGFVPRAGLTLAELRARLEGVHGFDQPMIDRLQRSLRLYDAMTQAQSRRERRAALVGLGITVKRHITTAGTIASVSIKGKERLRLVIPAVDVPARARSRGVEQPDGGASDTRDELDDVITAADAEAAAEVDDNMAYSQAVIDDADEQIEYIENENWGNCSVASGPSAGDRDNCWAAAAEAILAYAATKELAQVAQVAIQAALTAFNAAKAAAVAGVAAATLSISEAAAMITTALGVLVGTTTGQFIVIGAGVVLTACYVYELLHCMNIIGSPEPVLSFQGQ
jgi:hypothetical protein